MAFLDKLLGKKQNGGPSAAPGMVRDTPYQPAEPEIPVEGSDAYTLRAKRGKEGAVLLLIVSGRLDALSSPAFEADCARYIAPGVKHCVLDCQGLEYLSSAGLRSLMTLSMQLRSMHAVLVFSGLTESVRGIFHSAGLLKMFPVYETVEKALRSTQKG